MIFFFLNNKIATVFFWFSTDRHTCIMVKVTCSCYHTRFDSFIVYPVKFFVPDILKTFKIVTLFILLKHASKYLNHVQGHKMSAKLHHHNALVTHYFIIDLVIFFIPNIYYYQFLRSSFDSVMFEILNHGQGHFPLLKNCCTLMYCTIFILII